MDGHGHLLVVNLCEGAYMPPNQAKRLRLTQGGRQEEWPICWGRSPEIMLLINRKDDTGCVIPCPLNVHAVIKLFGADSFDHPHPAPWRGVLVNSRPSGNIANGLRLAWNHLTTNFQVVVTNEQLSSKKRNIIETSFVKGSGVHTRII